FHRTPDRNGRWIWPASGGDGAAAALADAVRSLRVRRPPAGLRGDRQIAAPAVACGRGVHVSASAGAQGHEDHASKSAHARVALVAEVLTSAYPDPFTLFADAVDLVRAEVREVAALGCTYIQIDAPELGTLVDKAPRTNESQPQAISTHRR